MTKDKIVEILQRERNCSDFDLEQYVADNKDYFQNFETDENVLDDFDLWREQSDLAIEKIMDADYWASV